MFQALILDFDGVIVDSEKYWPIVETEYYGKLVGTWQKEDQDSIVGMGMDNVYKVLVKNHNLSITEAEFDAIADEIAEEVYAQSKLVDGITDVIDQAVDLNMKLAIGSSSRKHWIENCMKLLGLDGAIPLIASGTDVAPGRSKPCPDIYLKAASLVDIDPAWCVAIEDSNNGIRSAKTAGMYCIALNHDHQNQEHGEADIVVDSLREVDLSALRL